MKLKHLLLLLMAIVSFSTARAATDESDFKFNDGVRYSQWVVNSRLNSFSANTAKMGLATFNADGTQIGSRDDGGKTKLDYVPGLVAKGVIEATRYYSQFTWAAPWTKPWFLSVADYGNKWYNVSEAGGSLDDLNGVKLYFALSELAKTDGYANSDAYNNAVAAIGHAVAGLKAHNTSCVIESGTLAGDDVVGGWWHKKAYNNQMWLDGQYMGPALLAQIINHNKSTANISTDDWKIIIKQLDAVWKMCWNAEDKLLYHAFEANGGKGTTDSHAELWAGLSTSNLHSASYWGRACGWYFLALVDILHEMDNAKLSSQNTYTDEDYTRIKGYLASLAAGLRERQDVNTGGWYQILDKDGTYSASEYNNGLPHTLTYNYIESSATAIFAAAYLKAIRLGYLAESEYGATAKKAYQCIVNNFFAADSNDGVHIFGSCRSAGLGSDKTDGTWAEGEKNFRDGSNEYYLLGYDATRVAKSDNETEGKVLGAFILASTEYEQLYQKDKILFSKDLAPAYPLTSADTSISIEAFGADNIEYRWYNVNDENTVVATTSTFTPAASGSYYCTATAGGETITSSTTNVTVEEKGNTTYKIWFAKIADGQKCNITENTTYFSGLDGISSSSSCNSTVTIDGTEYVITGRSIAQDPTISFAVNSGTGTLYMLTASNSTSNNRTFTLTNTSTLETKTAVTTNKNTICCVTFENIPTGSYTLKADGKIYLGFLCMKLSDGSDLTQFTITYDKNIGDDVTVSGMPAQVSVLDGKIVLPETAPAADGYTFCGWYKEKECTNKANTGDVIGGDITLYAKWRQNSNLALKKSVAWTPAVNGTIALGDLVSSSSTGDYSITSGNDVATFDSSTKTFTALKPGSFVLEQAEDATYAKGSVPVNVAIGTDVAKNGTNAYTVETAQTYSDGITVAREDITMTFGNDGFWTSGKSYTQGQNNPSPGKGGVPTAGTYYKFEPTKGGSLAVNISIGASRQLYVVKGDGTFIEAKDKDGNVVTGSPLTSAYNNGDVVFDVVADNTYYVYVDGSKANFYGFAFTPSAETPIEGNVIATFENPTTGTWICNENNGVKISNIGSLSNNEAVKLAKGNTLTMTVPAGITVTRIKVIASVNGTSDTYLSIADVQNTISCKDKAYYDVMFSFSNAITGETPVTFKNTGEKELLIKQVLVYGEDKTTESNSNAIFKYESSDLTFTKVEGAENTYEATIEVGAEKKDTNLDITVSTASGATVVCDNEGTVSDDKTTVTVKAPASIDSPATYTVTVTSADGTSITTYKITVKLKKQAIVLKYVLNDNSEDATEERRTNAEWFWDKLENPSKEFTANTLVLHAYLADSKGNATAEEITPLPSGITYESDMPSVATVDKDNGNITPVGNTLGRAYIYATLENAEYEAKETRCAVYIRDGYTYNVSDGSDKGNTPKLNEFRYITDKDGKNLLRMKFGGWKYNGGKYIKPSVCQGSNWTSTSDTDYVTDSWGELADSGVNGIDGFSKGFPGANDACDESMKPSTHYNSTRYGWFKAPSDDKNNLHDPNNIMETSPFTLPVRGAYMTFEPMVNGTLSVFIIQNGAWNTWNNSGTYKENGVEYTYSKGDIKKGEFRPHSFQVVNQRGLTLSQFSTKWSVDTKQSVTSKYYCVPDDDTHSSEGILSPNVADWPEFNDGRLTDGERADIVAAWKGGSRGMQNIVMLHDGSFLAIEKGIVKYTFYVTGHETYYFFSNFSKMGFCGANFTPDAGEGTQPVATLELNDQVAYPTVTATEDGEYEGNTEMTRYDVNKKEFVPLPKIKKHTFTVTKADETTIDGVNVKGAQAPQFKTITVQREFKQDQWTTLTLPFNMTQKKVEEVFGVGTELLLLKSSEMNGSSVRLHFIYHEIQNVLPGYPYLIKPTLKDADGNNYSNETTDASEIVEKNGALFLTSFNVPVKHITQGAKQLTFGEGPYLLKGVEKYCTPEATDKSPYSVKLKEGDVFLSDSNGKFYVSQGTSYCKGYRAYMTTADPQVTPAKSVILTYSGVEDNPDNGTATEISIAELSSDAVMALGLKGVYNLSGQKVADTADNLPAGIYVVNGQKIVVK